MGFREMRHIKLFEDFKKPPSTGYDKEYDTLHEEDTKLGHIKWSVKYQKDETIIDINIHVKESDLKKALIYDINEENNYNLTIPSILEYLNKSYGADQFNNSFIYDVSKGSLNSESSGLENAIEYHMDRIISKMLCELLEKNPSDFVKYPELKKWIFKEDVPVDLRRSNDVGLWDLKNK
jgi:hypothetical protein